MFFDGLRRWYHTVRYRAVRVMIPASAKRILDIGCGRPFRGMEDGAFLTFLGKGIGVDIKTVQMQHEVLIADAAKIPLRSHSIEVITMLETLEHVDDIDAVLQECKRLLVPHGILIISTPNNSLLWRSIWALWVRTFGKEWQGTHINNLKTSGWKRALEKHFRITRSKELFGCNLILKAKIN